VILDVVRQALAVVQTLPIEWWVSVADVACLIFWRLLFSCVSCLRDLLHPPACVPQGNTGWLGQPHRQLHRLAQASAHKMKDERTQDERLLSIQRKIALNTHTRRAAGDKREGEGRGEGEGDDKTSLSLA